jgi:hypothetical protein
MQAKRTLATIALVICVLLGPAFARADTTFDVSGSAIGFGPTCGNCAISGTLMVDTASGTLDGVDITFEGDPFSFSVLFTSGPGTR